jgi:two-component sensor histidine kinase
MSLFTPPSTSYENFYKEASFNLTWRFFSFMAVFYSGIVVASLFISEEIFYSTLAGWLFILVVLVILKSTRKYELVAYAYVIISSLLTVFILTVDYSQFNLIEMVFMFMTAFYAFVTLGWVMGVISLSIQLSVFIYYVLSRLSSTRPITVEYSESQLIALSICLTIAVIILGLLMVEFVKIRKAADLKYLEVNNDLIEINSLMNRQTQEKTVMLREIHHRVKNNLQVISSLLRLQSYEIAEENTRFHFQDAINRVSAMALIHEKMYQNEDLARIDLQSYVTTLANDLLKTHNQRVSIDLSVQAQIDNLSNDTLIPFALILNELITNSIKHAFTGKIERKDQYRHLKASAKRLFPVDLSG